MKPSHIFDKSSLQMTCLIKGYNPLLPTEITYVGKRKRKRSIVTALGVLPVALPTPDYNPVVLEMVHPHQKDGMIDFIESSHTYTVNLDRTYSDEIISVSTLVHQFFTEFNPDKILSKMTYSKQYGKYKGMSDSEIKQLWHENGQAASSAGTAFHFICECYCNGWREIQNDRIEVKQFLKFYREITQKGYVPFRTEMRLFTDEFTQICGTVDLLAIKHDHPPPEKCQGVLTLIDIDWKNSKKINTKSYDNQKGTGPCFELDDCNWSHYMLQQNMYKYILENWYGNWVYKGQTYTKLNIEAMFLCVCHPNYGESAKVIELPKNTEIIESIFEIRKKQLKKEF
jgi:hypothetical protein